MKIRSVKIVSQSSCETFELAINEAIRWGWQPYGYPVEIRGQYTQMLVTYEEINKNDA